MYNLKIMHRSGDETVPSMNLFLLARELDKLGCTVREFDHISNLPKGETFVTRYFQVKRYN